MKKRKVRYTLRALVLFGCLGLATISGCGGKPGQPGQSLSKQEVNTMEIKTAPFGTAPNGQQVQLYTLTNANGMTVKITNYGAIVTSIQTPDRDGKLGEVALGFDSVDGYVPNDPHFGGIVGRYANRIANGKFTLDGQEYTLAVNNAPNHLHGGITGFDRVVWQAEPLQKQNAIRLTYVSKDGEEGYPGNLTVVVTYTLTGFNDLKIDYEATTDKATPVNLTNHSYFNLSAGKEKDILNHIVTIHADQFTASDETLIPTGELKSVKGTPYDFTKPTRVGDRIENLQGYGYDLNYVVRNGGDRLVPAATVEDPATGRVMQVQTTQPGIQFYTAYHLDGTLTGHNNTVYNRYAGLCLEAQHFPDSPNQESFPSTILRPGEKYSETTVYKFGVKGE
ncbi:aldose epimerase family protein [Pontibacter sp. BT731]|uniref:aldose epimerase family protein n=1 Tax=Pontibacter coccineus TaxID=3063328 RepID=UPI0026E2030D|nr:aldose epimerase family protein [Pontibacter sp. BT731]MDO6388824.1 aldose epimerase family protein [Pontibacter sp. BT731]